MADDLLGLIERHGVGTAGSFRVVAASPRALVLLDPSGERTILGLDEEFARDVYPLADVPHVGAPDAIFVETYDRFPTAIAERAPGALVVVAPPRRTARNWPANIMVGAEREYLPQWHDAPFETARRIAGFRLQWVVITRGADGADAYGPGERIHVDTVAAQQVDATGAGDAFAAALLSALLARRPMADAMRMAARAGAAAVEVLQSVPLNALEAISDQWPATG